MLRLSSVLAAGSLVALLAGCAATDDGRPLAATLPAAFSGTLPCGSVDATPCDAADGQLVLLPDQLFVLSERAPGTDAPAAVRLGRWLLSSDGRQLRLYAADLPPRTLQVATAGQLRWGEAEGGPAVTWQRSRHRGGSTPLLELQGSYRPPAEGERTASFQECRTGARMAVVEDGAQLATLHARERQLAAGTDEAQGLLMTVVGRVDWSARAELPRLEVERLVRASPTLQCAPRPANVALAGSVWQLVEVDGYRLPEGGQRPPFLQFDEQGALAGSTGCNRIAGHYVLTGATLTFSNLATTRMSCPGAAVLEQLVTDLLRRVARWNVLESTLELYDETGTLLGRFEARSPSPLR